MKRSPVVEWIFNTGWAPIAAVGLIIVVFLAGSAVGSRSARNSIKEAAAVEQVTAADATESPSFVVIVNGTDCRVSY